MDGRGFERRDVYKRQAHLRSVILGRSVDIPIIDGEIQLGEFGCVYFGDWDQVRARERKVIVQVTGLEQ